MHWVAVALVFGLGCRFGFDPTAGDDASQGPLTYRDAVMADGPLSYWRMGGANTSATDEQGAVSGVFTGVCIFGEPGALAGDTDTATRFDGTGCKVSLGNNYNFVGTAPMTAEVWVNPSTTTAYEHYITFQTRNASAPIDGWAMFRDTALGVMVERVVAGSGKKTSPIEIPKGAWTYLVMIYDGTQMQLYINAVLVASLADTRALNSVVAIALIGAHSTSAYVTGDMDEVAVYDKVLSPARLAEHYDIAINGPR